MTYLSETLCVCYIIKANKIRGIEDFEGAVIRHEGTSKNSRYEKYCCKQVGHKYFDGRGVLGIYPGILLSYVI